MLLVFSTMGKGNVSSMNALQDLIAKFKSGPSDLVSVDIGNTGIKAVRMRKTKEANQVVAVDVLPPALNQGDLASGIVPLDLPQKLKARYVSLAIAGEGATVKLLSFPGPFKDSSIDKVIESLGIEDIEKYRIAYKLISEGHGRSESRILAVGLPENLAQTAALLFPVGRPAPFSLEISGLASITAFLNGPATKHKNDAVAAIDFGDNASTFTLFNKGTLALVRRFEIGTDDIVDKVQESLGVDRETAQGIITDGAFDISQSVSEIMEPLIKQLIVSRDFVERRENCSIVRLYASGGVVLSHDSLDEMRSSMGIEVDTWNPFEAENLVIMPDAIPAHLKGQEWRFTAAVGSCLATFEES